MGGDPRRQVLAAGNVAQFSGRDASGSYVLSEREALLSQLRYVSNRPGPTISEVLAGSNFEDARWDPWLHSIVLPIGTEAFGQASAPCVVGAQRQSDGNIGQLVNGLSGMCTPHPGACQSGVGNPVGNGCSVGQAGPTCLGNPVRASRPVVTVDGRCADSGGVLPESVRVVGNNMPHPTGLARAGNSLGDRGLGVTASIHSGMPIHAQRPPTVDGLASSGGALQRSFAGRGVN